MIRKNLYYIEGTRASGKTFLAEQLKEDYFKFQFVDWFKELNLENNSKDTHLFALGKEILLMQLSNMSFLDRTLFVDRGIITVFVWGITQKRISYEEALDQIMALNQRKLFDNCGFIFIEGSKSKTHLNKDFWDGSDNELERKLFNKIFRILMKLYPYSLSLQPYDLTRGRKMWFYSIPAYVNRRTSNPT